jgi:mono/diheme cytochrome c family protein
MRMRHFALPLVWSAIAAVVVAQQTSVPAPPAVTPAAAPVTFNGEVAPILFDHCVACHRPGQMAPMSFVTYESTRPWARAIQQQVTARTMPPWGADPTVGHFANDPSLTNAEIATITQWVADGAPRGTAALPAVPDQPEQWQIGTPDLVLSIPEPTRVPATGLVDYLYVEIPTGLTEDRWIQAVEIRPTNRKAVHHALAFVKVPGLATPPPTGRGDGTSCNEDVCGDIEMHDARMGPILAASAVGTNPEIYPPGTAKLLRKGSVITLQVHYTPYGEEATDQIGVGLVFAKQPPTTELKMVPSSKQGFDIPPHAANHVVETSIEFKKDATIWSIGPHAHLRNKSWRYELRHADGRIDPLLVVPRFDFNWQLVYRFAQPIPVKAGSRLHAVGVFDNSAANKDNPDPNVTVRWGTMTGDEMMFSSVVYSLTPAPRPASPR